MGKLSVAENISTKYQQLSKCYSILSDLKSKQNCMYSIYAGGWPVYTHEIERAGVSMDDIYKHISKLIEHKKIELELELENLKCE